MAPDRIEKRANQKNGRNGAKVGRRSTNKTNEKEQCVGMYEIDGNEVVVISASSSEIDKSRIQ